MSVCKNIKGFTRKHEWLADLFALLAVAILFGSVLLGILFGAMPGLTSTLGVALLTALTYSMNTEMAMICLLAIYVGGTYGGSYASILINIPGTAAAAATAMDGYPLAVKGEGGRAIGLTSARCCLNRFTAEACCCGPCRPSFPQRPGSVFSTTFGFDK